MDARAFPLGTMAELGRAIAEGRMHLTVAAWIAVAIVGLISTVLLRITVRVVAKTSDNAWDNALAYGIATVLLGWPIAKLIATGNPILWATVPLVLWLGQTIALRAIYEVKTGRAMVIGLVHSALLGLTVSALALGIAAVAAYILYGKIISDPMFLVRLLFRLIGIPFPF